MGKCADKINLIGNENCALQTRFVQFYGFNLSGKKAMAPLTAFNTFSNLKYLRQ